MNPEPHHRDANCLELFEKLSAYIDDELDRPTARKIERHMRDCLACHNCVETLRRTTQICRRLVEQEVPESFSRRLRKSLHALGDT